MGQFTFIVLVPRRWRQKERSSNQPGLHKTRKGLGWGGNRKKERDKKKMKKSQISRKPFRRGKTANKTPGVGDVALVGERFPSMHEALVGLPVLQKTRSGGTHQ